MTTEKADLSTSSKAVQTPTYWDVRSVSGAGPRCGCGARSRLHVVNGLGRPAPEQDYFLCRDCTVEAVQTFLSTTKSPHYGRCADAHIERECKAGTCIYCREAGNV